ncbi:hypothetical protein [Actinoplanes sp. NPDC089786]|uniref:hypothetical protein n=1 Tax=Actinoplanes sp. NPDC089786 TaxID=3155185 RepID=UPI003426D888
MLRKHNRQGVVLAAVLSVVQGCGTNPPAEVPVAPAPSASASPSALATASPDPKLAAILAGRRKVTIHLVPAGRDLSATYEGPIVADGTDHDGDLFLTRAGGTPATFSFADRGAAG